jgi:hypothetical protein
MIKNTYETACASLLLVAFGTTAVAQSCPSALGENTKKAAESCARMQGAAFGVYLVPGRGYACTIKSATSETGYQIVAGITVDRCNKPLLLNKIPNGVELDVNLSSLPGAWVWIADN